MKLTLLLCLLTLFYSCQTVKDKGVAPSLLNQMRLVMKVDNEVQVGMAYVSNSSKKLSVRTFGEGSLNIRAAGSCGGHYDESFNSDTKWIDVDLKRFTDLSSCILTLEMKIKKTDSNVSGQVFIVESNNPDILPLKVSYSGKEALGVISFQLTEDSNNKSSDWIQEDSFFKVYPKATRGVITLKSSCKTKEGTYAYAELPYESVPVTVPLDLIYSQLGGIVKSCTITALINPDDSMKEQVDVLVNVYKSFGSWLAKPIVTENDLGQTCFSFTDEFTIGVGVNDDDKFGKKKCASGDSFEVIGITSNLRLFYGVYKLKIWGVQ